MRRRLLQCGALLICLAVAYMTWCILFGYKWKVSDDVLRQLDIDEMVSKRAGLMALGFSEVSREEVPALVAVESPLGMADEPFVMGVLLDERPSEAWKVTGTSYFNFDEDTTKKRFSHVLKIESDAGYISIYYDSDDLFAAQSKLEAYLLRLYDQVMTDR